MSNLLGTLLVKMALDASDFDKNLQGAAGKLQNVGASMTRIGQKMTLGVTLPMMAAGGAAIAMATDYNASLANIASLGVPTDRIDEFKGAIQSMAIEVGKMPTDLADGMYQVVSAFGDGADGLAILETNARAAAAGLATTTEAINLTSAVTKGYGDVSAQAVQHAADLAFETVKLGQTTFPELAASIGLVVPIAASLGVAQEELFGVMATGTGVTGGASEVATQLRGVLQSLMSPTKGMTELLDSMGYSSGQAMLDQLGLQGTIQTLVKAAQDAGVPLQNYISSIEGQTLALALAGGQSDAYTEKLAAMNDVTGAVDEAFQAQTEGVNATGFSMAQVSVKAAVLAQKLGDGLAPALNKILDLAQPLIDWLIGVADKFAAADEPTQNMILALGAIVVAAGPVLGVLGSLSTIIGMVSSAASVAGVAMPIIGTVLTALAGPVGIAIGLIAGLALAWNTDFLGMRTYIEKFMADLGPQWTAFVERMKADWESGDWLVQVQEGWGNATGQAGDWLMGFTNGFQTDAWQMEPASPISGSIGQVIQNFNGPVDERSVRMGTEAGILDVLRQIGGR